MANILIDNDGIIKLCDFGLSKLISPGKTDDERCGTPMTMSPEAVKGDPYRISPDWWAIGIIIYQLMNKKDPFEKPSVPELLESIVKDEW